MLQQINKKLFLLDSCISVGCVNLTRLRPEYLLLANNVLTNSPEILQIFKGDFLKLSFLHSDQSRW